jgi:hypothetical protein
VPVPATAHRTALSVAELAVEPSPYTVVVNMIIFHVAARSRLEPKIEHTLPAQQAVLQRPHMLQHMVNC